ncbi:hypothetical protein [Thiohalorhabdus methylotrophus]|uniref:Uncharacterized protein n=1 Tax=Thiohalorhabdus methylotrophus TaxID=3242694 RepID=A0ABV4TXL8_9GAMM
MSLDTFSKSNLDVQEDKTWGPSGFMAWINWAFPVPMLGFVVAVSDLVDTFIIFIENPSLQEFGKFSFLLFGSFLFIYMLLSAFVRALEGMWVARKLIKDGEEVWVIRYFFPLYYININDVDCIEEFRIASWRYYFTLLSGYEFTGNRRNYKISLKDGRYFLLNGICFDPYEFFKKGGGGKGSL